MMHSSSGLSPTIVLVSSWHSSAPWKRRNYKGKEIIKYVNKVSTYLLESTSCWSTELCWFLVAPCHGRVLGHSLLRQLALLSWPFLAFLGCCVANSFILTLLILDSVTLHNIILNLCKYCSIGIDKYVLTNLMRNLLGPALRLVLGPTDNLPLYVTVLDQGLPADLSGHIVSYVHHLYVTDLPEDFITLFLLL